MVADELVSQLDNLIREYLSANADKKEEVKKFCTSYVAKGDYTAIKEPPMLGKMIADFRAKFNITT